MFKRKPPAFLYLVPLLAAAGALLFFSQVVAARKAEINGTIAHYQRFVAPSAGPMEAGTPRAPAVLELPAGPCTVFYESFGTFDGETFDTPTRQLWPVKTRPAMELSVTRDDGADKGQKVAVLTAGTDPDGEEQKRIEANPKGSMPKNRGLVVYRRSGCGRDGHGMWLLDIPAAGFYKFETRYAEGVQLDPDAITVPPELTKAQSKARFKQGYEEKAYEDNRRQQVEERALAQVRAEPVLFAVGPDPLGQTLFSPTSIYGAAGICAFVLTACLIMAVMLWALRTRKAE